MKIGKNLCCIFFSAFISMVISCNFLTPLNELDYIGKKYDIIFSNFLPSNETVGENVNFQWTHSENIQLFHLQVSTSPYFENNLVVDEPDLTENTYNIVMDEGTYYWRICYYYNGEWMPWTKNMTINVVLNPVLGNTDLNFEYISTNAETSFTWNLSGDLTPYLQKEKVYSGSYALCFGDPVTGSEQKEILELTIESEESYILSFHYMMDCYGEFYFYDDASSSENEELRRNYSAWRSLKTEIIPPGTHTFRWEYNQYINEYDGNSVWLDNIEKTVIHGEDLCNLKFENQGISDEDSVIFTYSGNVAPYIQSEFYNEGNNALCFEIPDGSGSSIAETTLNISEPSVLYLDYNRYKSGNLSFKMDSVPIDNYSGSSTSAWITRAYTIPAGTHTFQWEHQNLYSSSERAVYLDNLYFRTIYDNNKCDLGFENIDGSGDDIVTFSYSGDNFPYIQTEVTNEGNNALCFFGQFGDDKSIAELTLDFSSAVILSFDSKASTYGQIYLYIDDLLIYNLWISEWRNYTSPIIQKGTHTIRWEFEQWADTSFDAIVHSYLDSIIFTEIDGEDHCDLGFENQDGVGEEIVTFRYLGDQLAYIQSEVFNEGNSALCFGNVEEDKECIAEVTLDFSVPSTISFDTLVDSYGDLYFYIDYEDGDISEFTYSTDSWYTYTSSVIPSGTHTFRWKYLQDWTNYDGDSAWLDNIVINPM